MTEGTPNPPAPHPRKPWVGAGIGLGLALVLGVGVYALRRGDAEADPERFQQRVNAMAQALIQDHWAVMRQAVDQIGSEEGAKAFFASNPGLATRIPSEAAFLAKARSWRPLLQPLPEVLPGLETHDLSYAEKKGQTEMSYRIANGTCIFMKWSENRLVEMRIY